MCRREVGARKCAVLKDYRTRYYRRYELEVGTLNKVLRFKRRLHYRLLAARSSSFSLKKCLDINANGQISATCPSSSQSGRAQQLAALLDVVAERPLRTEKLPEKFLRRSIVTTSSNWIQNKNTVVSGGNRGPGGDVQSRHAVNYLSAAKTQPPEGTHPCGLVPADASLRRRSFLSKLSFDSMRDRASPMPRTATPDQPHPPLYFYSDPNSADPICPPQTGR